MFEKNFNVQFSYDYKKNQYSLIYFFYIFFFILDNSEIKVIVKGFCLFISVIFIDAQNMVFWNTFVINFFYHLKWSRPSPLQNKIQLRIKLSQVMSRGRMIYAANKKHQYTVGDSHQTTFTDPHHYLQMQIVPTATSMATSITFP